MSDLQKILNSYHMVVLIVLTILLNSLFSIISRFKKAWIIHSEFRIQQSLVNFTVRFSLFSEFVKILGHPDHGSL